VLALNAGSSNLKWTLLDASDSSTLDAGREEWSAPELERRGEQLRATLRRIARFDAVGHRVVHGGTRFASATVIDAGVRADLEALAALDPLHMRPALAGIDAVSAEFPTVPQVAAFDTSFHATMPAAAAGYALPFEWSERWGVKRFGFHGLSVRYATDRARAMLRDLPARLIVCHLGSGCSITAVERGRSIDTTMGFTPLEGVMMATRSGDVDPGVLLYLQARCGVGLDELGDALANRSGLLGVSGVSGDLRRVLDAADAGQPRARLAYDRFIWTLVRAVGAMAGVLGGVDAIVFTGGIGENSARVRQDVAAALAFAGLRLDPGAASGAGDRAISAADSRVAALVIEAREDLVILAEVVERTLPSGADGRVRRRDYSDV
jgi:acetate kinase